MITSNANGDSFHALNPNPNLNVNPTYIYVGDERAPEPSPRNFGKTPSTVI